MFYRVLNMLKKNNQMFNYIYRLLSISIIDKLEQGYVKEGRSTNLHLFAKSNDFYTNFYEL